MKVTGVKFEAVLDQTLNGIKEELKNYKDFDLVIGLPFGAEDENIASLLQSIDGVLQFWTGRRQLIVCVGESKARTVLKTIRDGNISHSHISFLLPEVIEGRGTAIRAIIEIGKYIDADLLLFDANISELQEAEIENGWLERLLVPIQGQYDLVLGSAGRNLEMSGESYLLTAPVLEMFYGFRVRDPLGGIYGISHDFVEMLAHEARFWGNYIAGCGIDFWIVTRAVSWNLDICTVNMEGKVKTPPPAVRNKM
ncbi:MAG: hypothetical protein LBK69_06225, partial [Syntrophomonadaceae bacterium]|nr:hypothetical protein [Syntrophomonadaceae bacterium]